MKNIFKHISVLLSVALVASFAACTPEVEDGPEDLGLGIKVFFPTKVIANTPMTINGSGFAAVTEVEFPAGVKVTDFEIVSDEMIRVTAPSGIAAEGGYLVVRTASEQAESSQLLTLGHPTITGYNKQAGETIKGGEQLIIYGQDLEFLESIEILDGDGNPLIIPDEAFYRKGTNTVIIVLPNKIYEGTYAGKITTFDGTETIMPELAYEPGSQGGHWETVITSVWKNDGSVGAASWNSTYRFALEGHDGASECVAEIAPDFWEVIKTGTFYLKITPDADWFQIRVVTGWWSEQYPVSDDSGAADFNVNSPEMTDNGDGTYTLCLTFGDHPIAGTIDEKHLLFTGSGFIIQEIYLQEEVWVEGEGEVRKEVVLWEGEAVADNWGNQPNLLSDAGIELQEAGAKVDQEVRFYITPMDTAWKLKIVEGHWGPEYCAYCAAGTDTNNGEFTEFDLEANGGYIPLTLTQEILDAAFTQQWWGGTFIANGDKVTITKITLY